MDWMEMSVQCCFLQCDASCTNSNFFDSVHIVLQSWLLDCWTTNHLKLFVDWHCKQLICCLFFCYRYIGQASSNLFDIEREMMGFMFDIDNIHNLLILAPFLIAQFVMLDLNVCFQHWLRIFRIQLRSGVDYCLWSCLCNVCSIYFFNYEAWSPAGCNTSEWHKKAELNSDLFIGDMGFVCNTIALFIFNLGVVPISVKSIRAGRSEIFQKGFIFQKN